MFSCLLKARKNLIFWRRTAHALRMFFSSEYRLNWSQIKEVWGIITLVRHDLCMISFFGRRAQRLGQIGNIDIDLEVSCTIFNGNHSSFYGLARHSSVVGGISVVKR